MLVVRRGFGLVGEGGEAVERPGPETFVGEISEPALNQVQPGLARRGEVQVPSLLTRLGQPLPHLGALVSREVVQNDVDLEVSLHLSS